jgi:hypothetical protein
LILPLRSARYLAPWPPAPPSAGSAGCDAAVPLAAGDNQFSFSTTNGVVEIRYPKSGALLGPYVAE